MLSISEINNFPQHEQVFAALREIAQKYCPEELQQERIWMLSLLTILEQWQRKMMDMNILMIYKPWIR